MEIVANFGKLQSGLKRRQTCQFVEKYNKIQITNFRNLQNSTKFFQMYVSICRDIRKKSALKNLQILEIRKIVLKVTKCADSWRNTEKSEFAKFENF